MAAQPGHKKAGGRTKGTPNLKTLDLIATLEEKGYFPVAELIRVSEEAWREYGRAAEIHDAIQNNRKRAGLPLMTETDAPKYLKIAQSCAADLMPYMYPRRKAIEFSGDADKTLRTFADIMLSITGKS